MRVLLQGLTPGMEHCSDADLCAQMPGVGGEGGECLGGRAEQDRVDGGLVLEGDLACQRRQGEDDVEIRHRQQFGLSMREPFGARQPLALGTMTVAARIVGDPCAAAIVALLEVTAERRRPARRDGAHDAPLDAAELPGAGLPKRFAVAAEHVRHLQNRSHGTAQPGGTTSRRSRSSGLGVLLMVLVATWV